jgi:hypothetical protein
MNSGIEILNKIQSKWKAEMTNFNFDSLIPLALVISVK